MNTRIIKAKKYHEVNYAYFFDYTARDGETHIAFDKRAPDNIFYIPANCFYLGYLSEEEAPGFVAMVEQRGYIDPSSAQFIFNTYKAICT